jgi:hypothetical protein
MLTCLERIAASGVARPRLWTTGYPIGHRDFELRTVQLGDAHAAVVFCSRWMKNGGAIMGSVGCGRQRYGISYTNSERGRHQRECVGEI